MLQTNHIFIVGLNRTGTNMVRKVLNSSQDVGLCDETHFLKHWVGYQGYQKELANVADISTDVGVEKVVDYIYNIQSNFWRGKNFWKWIQANTDREVFLQKLLQTDRNEHAILDVIMSLYANGKPIQGDKTPAHIHSVPTLMKWYPNAKFIHMFRDPRAIFASEKRRQSVEYVTLPFRILGKSELLLETFLSLHIVITWLHIIRLHHQYQRLYPNNYRLYKYEELVSKPEFYFKEICDWVGIEFTEQMLQQTFQNSSLVPRHQAQGIDASAADRWRKHLHPITNKWIVFLSKKHLMEFGYSH